jgi:hypothetical protein
MNNHFPLPLSLSAAPNPVLLAAPQRPPMYMPAPWIQKRQGARLPLSGEDGGGSTGAGAAALELWSGGLGAPGTGQASPAAVTHHPESHRHHRWNRSWQAGIPAVLCDGEPIKGARCWICCMGQTRAARGHHTHLRETAPPPSCSRSHYPVPILLQELKRVPAGRKRGRMAPHGRASLVVNHSLSRPPWPATLVWRLAAARGSSRLHRFVSPPHSDLEPPPAPGVLADEVPRQTT